MLSLTLVSKLNSQTMGIVKNFNIEDHLCSNNVNCIFQDTEGYLWVGTGNGVSRFNGLDFKNYDVSDGLCDNTITGITEDSKNRIWFLTSNDCLSYYKSGQIVNSDSIPTLDFKSSTLEFSFLVENKQGDLYFSGKGNEVIRLTADLSDIEIQKNNSDKNVRIKPLKNESGKIEYYKCLVDWNDSLAHPTYPIDIIQYEQGTISLTRNGIYNTTSNGSHLIVATDQLIDYHSLENLYLTENRELFVYGAELIGYKIEDFLFEGCSITRLPKISYSQILNDDDQNVWYASYSDGLHLISSAQSDITLYQHRPNEITTCLAKSIDGDILAGTRGNRLLKFSERKLIDLIQIGGSYDVSSFNEVHVDALSGRFWCGGDFSLMGIKMNKNQPLGAGLQDVISLPLEGINDLFTHNSNELYVATEQGIYKTFLGNQFPDLELVPESEDLDVEHLLIDSYNTLWFSVNDQLYYIKNKELKQFSPDEYSFKTKINALEIIGKNTIAISTYGNGVFFIKNKTIIHHLDEKNGLLSNLCTNLYVEDSKHYLATRKGIIIYEWNGSSTKIKSSFSHLNGLPSNKVNDVLVKDSLVYLATADGLIIFNSFKQERDITRYVKPPKIHLNTFKSKDKEFDFGKKFDLSYFDTFITIAYQAITFERPDELIYAYKFFDSDTEWTQTKNNALEFPRLPAGDYDFQLKAKKHNSDWSEPISISFTSHPAFWNTWWFRMIGLIILSGITFLVLRFYARRKYERQLAVIQKEQALLEERNRISADMHDDLGSELTRIVILSRIAKTKLQLPKEKEKPINDIDQAAEGIVKKMNEIIWALNPTNDTLENLISYLQKYINDYLDVRDLSGRVKMPDIIPELKVRAAFRRNIFLIVKECLHNIHKHAKATRVDAEIRISDDLEINIIENGVGFDMEKTRRFGNGLINMQKRASDINGSASQWSEIGEGSKLKIIVPLTKNHAFVLDDNRK